MNLFECFLMSLRLLHDVGIFMFKIQVFVVGSLELYPS